MRTFLLDNYDSFTFNLYQQVARLQGGAEPLVFRNDAISFWDLHDLAPDRLIISPGPGNPARQDCLGIGREAILKLGPRVPVLGVCLGHLGIVEAFGGQVVSSPAPRHGKTSDIHHDGSSLFAGLPAPFAAMRYHSLMGERPSLPACLDMTAWTADGLVMAVRHREHPIVGVQFHPESIGTEQGDAVMRAFLEDRF